MSFLQNLINRKTSLKQIDTVVTCADGTRYIERRHSSSSNNHEIIPQPNTSGFVIDTTPDTMPSNVIQNLFIGSQDCCDPVILQIHNIQVVLSIGIESPHKEQTIEYYHVECLDLPETDLKTVLAKTNLIIKENLNNHIKKNILVHCNAGVSRSAAVVIGYLMQELQMNYEDAYSLLKSVRTCIQPNPGFTKQLKSL